MKASLIYAFRFLTHNKKKSFSVWISLVLASAMISICFFTVDSIDRTILNDAESESGGYNLYLFGTKSEVEDLVSQYGDQIKRMSHTEIIGCISPNLYLTADDMMIQELIQNNTITVNGELPEIGEILINQLDLTYLGNPKIGDLIEVEIKFSDGSSVLNTFRVSGIYSGNNCPFVDDLPIALVGNERVDINSNVQAFDLTYIRTATGHDGTSLYGEIEHFAFEHGNELSNLKFGHTLHIMLYYQGLQEHLFILYFSSQ